MNLAKSHAACDRASHHGPGVMFVLCAERMCQHADPDRSMSQENTPCRGVREMPSRSAPTGLVDMHQRRVGAKLLVVDIQRCEHAVLQLQSMEFGVLRFDLRDAVPVAAPDVDEVRDSAEQPPLSPRFQADCHCSRDALMARSSSCSMCTLSG